MKELRLYSFVNFYLSSIQQGIQTGHAAVDLVRKAGTTPCVGDWADNHKTFIILNGGCSEELNEIANITKASGFPCVHFRESDIALNGILTCVAVILPEYIFDTKVLHDVNWTYPLYVHTDYDGKAHTYYPEDQFYPIVSLVKSRKLAI